MPTPFGKYQLLERLAAGGMAEVFRAEMGGAAGFAKRVALKRIHPAFSGERDFVTMFIDEARLASRLSHANIVQVFDFGETDGAYYLTMELVDGVDVARLHQAAQASGQPIPLPTAAYICAEVASALDYAHAQRDDAGKLIGLVHRDVSPQNILCSCSGDVKLADFGIAKAAGKLHVTMTGALVGKLRYMSPEQARGLPLDGRSDIFSLGVVLYELLTGKPPFEGAGPEVLERIKNDPVVPPRQRNPGVPAALDQAVMKALARDPAARPATAALLARELRAFVHASAPGYSREDLAAFVATLAPREGQRSAATSSAAHAATARPAGSVLPAAAGPARTAVPAGPVTVGERPGARGHGDQRGLMSNVGGAGGAAMNEPAWTSSGTPGQGHTGSYAGSGTGSFAGSYSGTQASGTDGSWSREPLPPARLGRWLAILVVLGLMAAGAIGYQLYGPMLRGLAGLGPADGGTGRPIRTAADAGRALTSPAGDAGPTLPAEHDGKVISRGDLRVPAPVPEGVIQRLLVAWRARPGYKVATLGKSQPGYLLVLWAVADGIARQEIDAAGKLHATPLDAAMQNRLRPLGLDEIVQSTLDFWRQTGELPEDFASAARGFLRQNAYAATSRIPGEPLYDASALAILFFPEAARAQEMLVRSRGALDGWEATPDRLLNPALASLEPALARLRRLDQGSRFLGALDRYERARPADEEVSFWGGPSASGARLRLLPPSGADPTRRVRLRLSPTSTSAPGALISLGSLRLRDARNRTSEPSGLAPRVNLPVQGAVDMAIDFADPPEGADDDVLVLELPSGPGTWKALRVRCLPRGDRRSRIVAPAGEAVRLGPATQPTRVTADGGVAAPADAGAALPPSPPPAPAPLPPSTPPTFAVPPGTEPSEPNPGASTPPP